MTIIRILPHAEYCPEGREIQAISGTSICEALLDNGISIEHACDMSCACTTCHVIVKEGLASLNAIKAWSLKYRATPSITPKRITDCSCVKLF